jgi:hypothetical protein
MDPLTKTYVSLGLVVLAAFEFWSAMRIFGKKGGGAGSHAKLILRLHRIVGYGFLIYFVWISWVCIDLMGRLAEVGKPLDLRGMFHGFLSMAIFGILLVKIGFTRFYRNFRPSVPAMGMIVSVGTIVIWGVAGGMFLILF